MDSQNSNLDWLMPSPNQGPDFVAQISTHYGATDITDESGHFQRMLISFMDDSGNWAGDLQWGPHIKDESVPVVLSTDHPDIDVNLVNNVVSVVQSGVSETFITNDHLTVFNSGEEKVQKRFDLGESDTNFYVGRADLYVGDDQPLWDIKRIGFSGPNPSSIQWASGLMAWSDRVSGVYI